MDKIKHFIICASIIIGTSFFGTIVLGVLLAVTFAICKELYDSNQLNNKFDWYDILADITGILFGIYITRGH